MCFIPGLIFCSDLAFIYLCYFLCIFLRLLSCCLSVSWLCTLCGIECVCLWCYSFLPEFSKNINILFDIVVIFLVYPLDLHVLCCCCCCYYFSFDYKIFKFSFTTAWHPWLFIKDGVMVVVAAAIVIAAAVAVAEQHNFLKSYN